EAINARELECSVLGTMQEVRTSVVGEIRPQNEFYDYEAKYISDDSELIIPAPVSEETSNELRRLAEKVFRTLDGRGLARVDFFLDKDSGRLLFNEINTIPGFTSISMYPKLFEHAGLPCPELINELLKIALKGK
ncbi:MAG TPA: ATP-grasp domain-containing protein, partial [Clostridiales bacterium]|nr:ATP-grasp domain-containing protein [Clostridiales bacterium]